MLLIAGMLCCASPPVAAVDYKIVTASERGTYIKIGRDLAEFVAPSADIKLDALTSTGSAENVRLLRSEPGVKLALVQSDVYQSFSRHCSRRKQGGPCLDRAVAGDHAAL